MGRQKVMTSAGGMGVIFVGLSPIGSLYPHELAFRVYKSWAVIFFLFYCSFARAPRGRDGKDWETGSEDERLLCSSELCVSILFFFFSVLSLAYSHICMPCSPRVRVLVREHIVFPFTQWAGRVRNTAYTRGCAPRLFGLRHEVDGFCVFLPQLLLLRTWGERKVGCWRWGMKKHTNEVYQI